MKIKRGFTIIEIIVVIGIIAVLTVIIFPAINQIRAKNRDAERVSDLATLQLGLSLYYSQHSNEGYPKTIINNSNFSPKYVPPDSLVGPDGVAYAYIPLTLSANADSNTKCIYYHLGTTLELPSAQVDTADTFSSYNLNSITNGYHYCGVTQPAHGLATGTKSYNVRP